MTIPAASRAALLIPPLALLAHTVRALDCSGDRLDDFDGSGVPISDCDGNGWPDACDVAKGFVLQGSISDISRAYSFLSADLDSDGDLDLGLNGDGPEQGVMLLNDGQGRFSSIRTIAHPMSDLVVPADLDLDGDTDLLVPGPALYPLINHGRGIFEAGAWILFPPNDLLALGDLDGDADPDIASRSLSVGRDVVAMLQESPGFFGVRQVVVPAVRVGSLVIEDLDADGLNDVAIASESDVIAFLNNGFPFEESARHTLGAPPRLILAGDTDLDGDRDLVTVNLALEPFPGNMSVLANEGHGNLGLPRNYEAPLALLHAFLTDMDGDRDPDLLGISPDLHGVTVIWNEGERVFRAEEVWKAPFRIHVLEAGDLDTDGDLDVAVSLYSERHGVIVVLWNEGGGEFRFPPFESEDTGISALAAGDFDGDGDTDLAGARREMPGLTRYVNDGGLRIAGVEALERESQDVKAADLDADGDLDLALAAGRIGLFANLGNNDFEPILVAGLVSGFHLEVADLDADGLVDLAGTGETFVDIFFNDGGWRLRAFETYQVDARPTSMAAADLPVAGHIDLLVTTATAEGGRLTSLRNGGDGKFTVSHLDLARVPTDVVPGDLNGDGDTDVVLVDDLGIVFLNERGDGTLDPPERWNHGPVGAIALEDFDSDGDLDVAVALLREEQIVLHRNDGFELIMDSANQPAGPTRAIVAADFDGDGDSDLALGREELGLLVLYNAMSPRNRDCNANSIPDSCEIAAGLILDVDGDGLADDCGSVPFTRGDVDMSVEVNITDAIRILGWLFTSGEPPTCHSSADTDDNAAVDLTDAIYLLRFLFLSGDPPPAPYPDCGADPTIDDLGCRSAKRCSL